MTDELADAQQDAERAKDLERGGRQEEQEAEQADRREEKGGGEWMFRDAPADQPWEPPGTGHIDAENDDD